MVWKLKTEQRRLECFGWIQRNDRTEVKKAPLLSTFIRTVLESSGGYVQGNLYNSNHNGVSHCSRQRFWETLLLWNSFFFFFLNTTGVLGGPSEAIKTSCPRRKKTLQNTDRQHLRQAQECRGPAELLSAAMQVNKTPHQPLTPVFYFTSLVSLTLTHFSTRRLMKLLFYCFFLIPLPPHFFFLDEGKQQVMKTICSWGSESKKNASPPVMTLFPLE